MTESNKSNSEPKPTSEMIGRATAILAVVAAIASARWGACNLQAILEQGKVNDTWAYYQAKSIKQHEAEQTRDLAKALAGSVRSEGSSDPLAALEKKMAADARREAIEKLEQQGAAYRYQISRDKMVESSFWFELAFAGLQLGVILCTIATGGKRQMPFLIGVIFGVIGALLLVNGFHRFVHAPRSWYQGAAEQIANDIQSATAPVAEK
ncbi:MAG TPA: DUF4337 family protein [Tepidisphaeraceae bacterium]|jgi:hypothetical protein